MAENNDLKNESVGAGAAGGAALGAAIATTIFSSTFLSPLADACDEIAARWRTVRPPSGYDGPEPD